MARTARVTAELVGAWEIWDIDIMAPDAPDPITVEWLMENPGDWEYIQIADSGFDAQTFTEVEED